MRRWIVVAAISLSILAIFVIAFADGRPAPKPYVDVNDPSAVNSYVDAMCAGSPLPPLPDGQFNTIAVDCAGQ